MLRHHRLGSGQLGSGGRQLQAKIPFSSMSRFNLLQIDVEVEDPETSENPTQSFEIHNIVWRLTKLLAVIVISVGQKLLAYDHTHNILFFLHIYFELH